MKTDTGEILKRIHDYSLEEIMGERFRRLSLRPLRRRIPLRP